MDWPEAEVEIEQALMHVGIERYLAVQRIIARTNEQAVSLRNLAAAVGQCSSVLQGFAVAFQKAATPHNN